MLRLGRRHHFVGGKRVFEAAPGGFFAPIFRYQPGGTIDTTFGLGGMAFGNFPTVTISDVNSLLVEQDGSIVVGGTANGNTNDWALLRFTPAGRPDPTFGTSGAVMTTFGKSQETADALTEQPDGKILAVGNASATSAGGFDVARYNPDGSPDTTFGSGGTLSTSFSGDHANAQGVAVDPNGKIVVGGSVSLNGQPGVFFALARYLGRRARSIRRVRHGRSDDDLLGATQNDESNFDVAMGLDPGGNIVLASSGANFNVARFSGDPAVPATPSLLSADRLLQVSSSSTLPLVFTVQLSAVSAQQVTVTYSTANDTAVAGADYTAASGSLTFAPGMTSQVVTVLVKPNTVAEPNKSFVLNLSNPSGAPLINDQYSGVILTNQPLPPAAGSLDFTFGWAGFAQSHPGSTSGIDTANNVAVQADGKVVEVGSVTSPATLGPGFGIVRYNVDGTLDPTFGTGGIVSTPITSGSTASANAVLIQPNDDIVVVGGDGTNIVVARYLPSGLLDNTFGTQGIATIALPAADAGTGAGWQGQRAALDSQGNIIVGGSGTSPALGIFGAVIRLTSSGTQDLGFGQNGLALLKFAGGAAITNVDALIVQSNQQIVVSGGVGSLDPHWLIGRLNANGTIDTQFGNSGVVSTEFGAGGKNGETAYGLAQQADGKILAVGGAGQSTSGGFDIARYNTNGSLDVNFGSGGQVTTVFPNTTYSTALNIAVLATGKIVTSGTSLNGSGPASIALAAYTSSGALDTSFGTAGLAIPHTGGVSQFDLTMAVAPSGQVVLASNGQVVPGGGTFDFNVSRINTGAAPSISISSVTQPVATSATSMVFHLTLSQPLATPVTVQFQTVDGTALAGQDYTAQSNTLTFAAGSTTAAITVAISGNLYAEPAKSFFVNLTNPSGAFANSSQATGTIQNNNAATWFNPVNALDVNGDGVVSPLDALDIINRLNSIGGGTLPAAPIGAHDFYDTNADGVCSPLDALKVINFLNGQVTPTVASPQVVASSVAASGSGIVSPPNAASPIAPAPTAALTDVAFALTASAGQSQGVAAGNTPIGASPAVADARGSVTATSSSTPSVSSGALRPRHFDGRMTWGARPMSKTCST